MNQIIRDLPHTWPKALMFVAAVAIAAVFVLPMAYTVISSLKPLEEITKLPLQWLPESLDSIRFSNYAEPLHSSKFGRFILNSTIVAVAVTTASLIFCTLAGYSLSKFSYLGRDALFVVILMTLMIPLEVTFIPMAIIVRAMGMSNSYWGLIVPVMITPFGVFWMRQFIMSIPDDYAEAARIDGLTEWQIFWRIIFPICKPALGALAIFSFMTNWNSLIWPLIVATDSDLWTIPVGLLSFQDEFFQPLNLIFAMSVIAVVPTVFMFVFVRRQLLTGLGVSGLK